MNIDADLEVVIRFGAFAGVFCALCWFESRFPRRRRTLPRRVRWPSNIGISALNQVLVRIVVPVTAIAFADLVQARGIGLLNVVDGAAWIEIVVAILALDLAIYGQHIVYHYVPLLWRFHRMHHADTEFDVTTGIRFHPLSILLSALIKLAVIALVGAPAVAVLAFEVLLNATSLFNHSNLAIPARVERHIRLFVVTPDMHRVHHSSVPRETNSNFGFNFPWWDRLFGTYRAQPAAPHETMTIGLETFRDERELRLDRMLWQPFRNA